MLLRKLLLAFVRRGRRPVAAPVVESVEDRDERLRAEREFSEQLERRAALLADELAQNAVERDRLAAERAEQTLRALAVREANREEKILLNLAPPLYVRRTRIDDEPAPVRAQADDDAGLL